jgi:hypothetical protein
VSSGASLFLTPSSPRPDSLSVGFLASFLPKQKGSRASSAGGATIFLIKQDGTKDTPFERRIYFWS